MVSSFIKGIRDAESRYIVNLQTINCINYEHSRNKLSVFGNLIIMLNIRHNFITMTASKSLRPELNTDTFKPARH